jgi:hypothetical protein
MAAGTTREQIAEIVFNSSEFHRREVAGYYESTVDGNDRFVNNSVPFIDDFDFLDRQADAGGLAAYTAALDHGALDQEIWALILSSDEFVAKTA